MTTAISKTAGDLEDDRQPEMVTETGNTYISETMRDSIEITMANPEFSMHDELDRSVGGYQMIATTTATGNIAKQVPKRLYCHFRLSVVVAVA